MDEKLIKLIYDYGKTLLRPPRPAPIKPSFESLFFERLMRRIK